MKKWGSQNNYHRRKIRTLRTGLFGVPQDLILGPRMKSWCVSAICHYQEEAQVLRFLRPELCSSDGHCSPSHTQTGYMKGFVLGLKYQQLWEESVTQQRTPKLWLRPPLPPDPNMKEELIREKDVNERELMDRWKMENIDLKKSLFLMEQISDQMFKKKRDPNILEMIFSTFSVNNTVMIA